MHIRDQHLAELREHGFALIEGFLEPDLLRSVQAALWEEYPRPQDYFSDPSAFSWLADSPIAGVKLLPFRSTPLNRLALHPDLIDAVERYLGTTEIDLYNAELWAKYAGAADYEQSHHRDYMNHTLVVPRADGQYAQVTCIMYLSDVSDGDGPTAVIPVQRSADVPIVPAYQEPGELIGREVRAVAPAGSLLLYRTDVLHRATGFTNPSGTRFVATSAYQARGAQWTGKISWPDRSWVQEMGPVLRDASVRERDLFGWPPPGHPYWCEQSLVDVAQRYPGIDLTPYRKTDAVRATDELS